LDLLISQSDSSAQIRQRHAKQSSPLPDASADMRINWVISRHIYPIVI
jgi:hypothetical protein